MSEVRQNPDSPAAPSEGGVEQLIGEISSMEGWLRDDQARMLWAAAHEVAPNGQIVEIGSYHGKSAIVLARASDPTVRVVAIDPHAGNDRGPGEWDGLAADGQADNEQFEANLRATGVWDRITHVREFSDDAHPHVSGEIDALYVDGAHGYAPAVSDISGWGDRVAPGGTMMIHDVYNSVFVSLAVIRLLYLSNEWTYLGHAQSMAQYRKVPSSRFANLGRHMRDIPWFARNMVLKALRAIGLERLGRVLGHEPGSGLY